MNNRFIIISCGYNCKKYIENHIQTIRNQTYNNFVHILVDDASTDNTYEKLIKCKYKNCFIYHNEKNQKWILNAIQYLNKHIESDNDIIVNVDMDDWLAHSDVLKHLDDIYQKDNIWITHSNFKYLKSGRTSHWIPDYSFDDIFNKKFRDRIWSFKHLRTMKSFLWNNIDRNDLKDKNGNYFKYTYDQAIFIPALEMSSDNHLYQFDEVQYIYNDMNPIQVEKIYRKEQEDNAKYIRSKCRYETLQR